MENRDKTPVLQDFKDVSEYKNSRIVKAAMLGLYRTKKFD